MGENKTMPCKTTFFSKYKSHTHKSSILSDCPKNGHL